jgi:hypothetical protein
VEDIKRALERFRLFRTEHIKAAKAIGQASRYVDEAAETIGDGVNELMAIIDGLVESTSAGIVESTNAGIAA